MTERYTGHDTRVENKALIHDPNLPWIVRKNDIFPTILHPRYANQEEAEIAAVGLNHANERQLVGATSRRTDRELADNEEART
jgi:hypothetical protein